MKKFHKKRPDPPTMSGHPSKKIKKNVRLLV